MCSTWCGYQELNYELCVCPPLNIAYPVRILACFRPLSEINSAIFFLRIEFLRSTSGKAFFSREIASSFDGKGVKLADIMANVRRYERRGLVYVRGYRVHDHHSPF